MGCSASKPEEGAREAGQDAPRAASETVQTQPGSETARSLRATRSPVLGAQSVSSRSHRSRRQTAPGDHLNAPLKPHLWTAKRRWTRSELSRERQEFFETRVTGRPEIWATLKNVVDLVAAGDISTAQGILDAAAITVPTGNLKQGVYDESGNLYQLPDHIICDPQNISPDPPEDAISEKSGHATEDESDLKTRRGDAGKLIIDEANAIKVRARLSDRGGPDVVVTLAREQTVRALIRKVQEGSNIAGEGRIRIAYMGKILHENESLPSQGWNEGHVVNALVFGE